jgi:hypothetical protein
MACPWELIILHWPNELSQSWPPRTYSILYFRLPIVFFFAIFLRFFSRFLEILAAIGQWKIFVLRPAAEPTMKFDSGSRRWTENVSYLLT